MEYVYFAAITFLSLASYAHLKTSGSIGMRPIPGTPIGNVYDWFGGGLSTLAFLGLFISGFIIFSWWVPIVVLLGALFLVGFLYWGIPLGPVHVFVGFPIGAVLTVVFFVMAI